MVDPPKRESSRAASATESAVGLSVARGELPAESVASLAGAFTFLLPHILTSVQNDVRRCRVSGLDDANARAMTERFWTVTRVSRWPPKE
jgi:hypothetical protein